MSPRNAEPMTDADVDRLFDDRDFSGDELSSDIEMEKALLGGLITLDGWAVASACDDGGLLPEHFRRADHQNLYRAIRELMLELGRIRPGAQHAPETPNTLTLCEHLNRRGIAAACGGLGLAASIADRPAGVASAGWMVRRLREASARRALLLKARALACDALDKSRTVEDIALDAASDIATVTDRETSDGLSSGADLVGAIDLDEAEPDDAEVISTGIEEVDRLMGGGIVGGRVTYLAARPGHGKSALKMNIGVNVARQGHGVCMYLLEMPATRKDKQGRKRAGDFARRLLTCISGVPIAAWQKYRSLPGRDRAEDRAEVRRGKRELSQLPLYTDDVSDTSYRALFASIRRLKTRCPELKLVTVDYIGLITGDRGEKKQEILKAASNGFVRLANDLDIHIMVLSQLNRDCEEARDKRPHAHNLRDSGELEQDADHLLMVQQPCNYDEWEAHTDVFWIAERKGRHTPRSEVCISFRPEEMWIGGPPIPDPIKDGAPATNVGSSWRRK